MDMVEKVREAISPILLRRETADQDSFDWATEVARAAIEAMREPTEGPTKAGMRAFVRYSGGDSAVDQDGANSIWNAMIDAALSDQPRPTEEKA